MPIGWVAAAGVVGSLATGAMQADASRSAANAQARSAANAQGISEQQYQDTVNRNAPFTQAGYGALSALDYGLGISPQTATGGGAAGTPTPSAYTPSGGSMSHFMANPNGGGITGLVPSAHNGLTSGGYTGSIPPSAAPNMTAGQGMGQIGGSGLPVSGTAGQPAGQAGGLGYGSLTKAFDTNDWQQLSPAYNFQLRQGQQGVQNAASAGQGAMSGAALKDLTDYNQSAANTSFNNAFNQYQTQQGNIFSRLSGIAQLGQSSANNTGQQGTTLAGQAGQAAVAQGSYTGAGIVGSANALSGGINSALPWLTAGGGGNNNPAAWDTENPNNFQDFQSSDRRLKTDIHLVGKLESGLNVYIFRYSKNPEITHMGVMADEVETLIPDAISTDEAGYQRVNYGMLR